MTKKNIGLICFFLAGCNCQTRLYFALLNCKLAKELITFNLKLLL